MNFIRKKTESNYLFLVLSISIATFMATLDGSIVNIALPTISSSFDISVTSVSWVSTIYLLVMAGCVLIFGKISGFIGYKRIFLSGFIIFSLGSLLCAVLPEITGSFLTLVGSRAFQGIGGAMISSVAPAMATAFIPLEKKGQAMGIVMTFSSLGTAIGPTIGGILTQFFSWHYIFLINVPVGIFAILFGGLVIPNSQELEARSKFDNSGAILIFVGLALLLFGLSEGTTMGWTSPTILGSLIIACITLGYFLFHELKTDDPILDFRIFKDRNFLILNLVLCLVFFSLSGFSYLMPFYLEYVDAYTTMNAGLVLTSLSFATMISGFLAGFIYDKTGGRPISILAAIILAIGYLMTTHLSTGTGLLFIVACLGMVGFGIGMIITPITNMIMTSSSKKYEGMVSSLICLERFAPLTIGIACYNLVFIQGMYTIAKNYGVTLQSPVSIQLKVLTAGFDLTFLGSFLIALCIFILTIVVRYRLHPDYASKE